MQSDPCGPCTPRPLRGLADLAHHVPTWSWICPRSNISQPTSATLASAPYATLASRTSGSHSNSNSLSQRVNIRTCPRMSTTIRTCLRACPRMSAPDSYTHLDSCSFHPRSYLECAKDQSPPRNLTPTWSACIFSHARPDARASRV